MHSEGVDFMAEQTSLRMTQFDPSHGTLRNYGLQLAPGVILAGRFEIQSMLGDGGMGTVFEAFDRVTQEHVAVKVLRTDLHLSTEAKQRFLAEAKVSRILSHPHIVRVHDVGVADGHHYLTMERLRGQSLRDHIKQHAARGERIPLSVALYIARQLIDTMSYANHYIVHRDLKPENIWITEQGIVKLMDFGIARVLANLSNTQFLLGTPYYMAPEQQNDPEHIDWRADQYVVGVVLYELLVGVVPAAAVSAPHTIRKDVPRSVSKAIMKALATDRDDRFKSWGAFREAIAESRFGVLPQLAVIPAVASQVASVTQMAGVALFSGAQYVAFRSIETLGPWAQRVAKMANRSMRRSAKRLGIKLVRFGRAAQPVLASMANVTRTMLRRLAAYLGRSLSRLAVSTYQMLRQLVFLVRSLRHPDLRAAFLARSAVMTRRMPRELVTWMGSVPWPHVRAGLVTGAALGVFFFLIPIAKKGAANASYQAVLAQATPEVQAPDTLIARASAPKTSSPSERELDQMLQQVESWGANLERERLAAETAAARISSKLIAAGNDPRSEQWRDELQSLRQKAQVAKSSLTIARKFAFNTDAMRQVQAQRVVAVSNWNDGRTDQAKAAFDRARGQVQQMLDSAVTVHNVMKMHGAAQLEWDAARSTVSVWGGDVGSLLSDTQARLMVAEELLNAGDFDAAKAQISQATLDTQEATAKFLRRVGSKYALLADRKIDSGDYQGARAAIDKAKRLKRLEQRFAAN
jgi:hypothetical protein